GNDGAHWTATPAQSGTDGLRSPWAGREDRQFPNRSSAAVWLQARTKAPQVPPSALSPPGWPDEAASAGRASHFARRPPPFPPSRSLRARDDPREGSPGRRTAAWRWQTTAG